MYDPIGYQECTRRVHELLRDERSHPASWRRLARLNQAMAHAEAGLAWLDPLFTEARAHYLDALFQVRPKSQKLRELTPTAIRNACETHGHTSATTTRLRTIRTLAWQSSGKPLDEELHQAEAKAKLTRGSGLIHLTAVLQLADLYERAGQYDTMIAAFDALTTDRTRLGLTGHEADGADIVIAAMYFVHGEVVRATRLMERAYVRQSERAGAELGELLDDLGAHLQMAECYVCTGQPASAEAVLRESLDRLGRYEDRWTHPEVHQLRHQTLYELGKALWHQHKPLEAAMFFGEAHDVAQDGAYRRKYRNAYTMSLLDDE